MQLKRYPILTKILVLVINTVVIFQFTSAADDSTVGPEPCKELDQDVQDDEEIMTRIVGGIIVGDQEFPYNLLLVADWLPQGQSLCGAVVLNVTHALTAVSCVKGAKEITIFAGVRERFNYVDADKDPNVQRRKAVKTIAHPMFNSSLETYARYDLAILEMSKPFVFNKQVGPVKLAPNGTKLPASGLICGFGCTTQARDNCQTDPKLYPSTLQKTFVSIYSNDNCAKVMNSLDEYFPGWICVGDNGKGPCNGDSGGPLVIKDSTGEGLLLGIASFATLDCACEGWPAVYTRVPNFRSWIDFGIDNSAENVIEVEVEAPVQEDTPKNKTRNDRKLMENEPQAQNYVTINNSLNNILVILGVCVILYTQ